MKKIKLWAGLLIIFASGFAVGFLVAGSQARKSFERVFSEGPRASKEIIVKRLTKELSLNEEQRARVDEIVGRTQAELFKLTREHQPKIRALIDAGIAEMKQYLDPEQCKKLDKHFEMVKKRWWGWRGPPPGGHWPGPPPPPPDDGMD